VLSISANLTPSRGGVTVLDALEALHGAGPTPVGTVPLPTGFAPLDEVLQGGLHAGDLTLLGGKPGQGKTTVALQWARHLAIGGNDVIFACYEHDVATLVVRLLLAELGQIVSGDICDDELRIETLRERVRSLSFGRDDPATVLGSDPLLVEVEERLRSYGRHLLLIPASGVRTDLTALGRVIDTRADGATVLFIDYLQKVPVLALPVHETERVTRVAEGLKELALQRSVAVVAVAAADHAGLVARRVHLHHLRGSSALAYEADVVVVLNEKLGIVSRLHLAYDTTRAHDFREHVVLSVEKNRIGLSDVHLEFRKDLANCRFDPGGRWVRERLWAEGSTEE
jgi:replicative DNA helicase